MSLAVLCNFPQIIMNEIMLCFRFDFDLIFGV